jgi:predicted PurR-regulated permease PerM
VDFRGTLIIGFMLALLTMVVVGLGSALTPLLVAFGFAYLLFPVIKKVEDWGIKRHYSVPAVFLGWTLLVILTMIAVVPGLIRDFQDLLQELPQSATTVIERIESFASDYGFSLTINKTSLNQFILDHTSEISTTLLKGLSSAFDGLFTNALRWLLSVLNIFLIPLFFFYLINDFEKITAGVQSLIPPRFQEKVRNFLEVTNTILSGYIRGQILVACILGLLYGVGLTIAGLKFGFLVGVMSGLLSIIPYAGFTIGFVTSVIIGLANYDGVGGFLSILLVFGIVQSLEGTVITPRLVGNKVGLSALTTMLALIIGGNLFGLIGMLIAIPTAAVLKLVLLEVIKEYHALEFLQLKK